MSVNRMGLVASPFGNVLPRITESLRQHRVLLLIAMVVNLGDVLTTHIGLASGISEGNPIPATLIANGGELAWLRTKFGLMALLVLAICMLSRRYPKLWHTFTVTNVVLLAAVLSNSAQILTR